MDTESIVYGCIKHLPVGSLAQRRTSCRHNRAAILSLPTADGWPFLCREMFSVPGEDLMGGTYHTQVIHFGMSYRAVEYEWEHWISKFESLLRGMYWVNAVVHLETELAGHHTFIWDSADGCHEPSQEPLRVRCEWAREGSIA
ncbi:MAG: hypothetical protein CVV10_08645 [Gammaproteobacteria bacterium HGW-Gammaproteobacteria-14]|nr:MAG: hypothetical protein CVV10_08645 [Gammaproteobacteria bacterium HGW-Gammaproteobacteria-14]